MNPGSSFIIATRNRPDELLVAVASIAAQSVLPGELCIVDSSDETPVRATIEELCAGVGLPLDYFHPAPRGLPVQRNAGIDRTTGDPVFFVDDDVKLEAGCHEEIVAEYERWGDELGGMRATAVHPAHPPLISVLWRKLFGVGGWWPEASGRMRAGLYVEGVSVSASVRRVEYLTGWFMSYRRRVFEEERFDEALAGYASQEDIDFSYRVARRYILLQTPKARCRHFQTTSSRMTTHQVERMKLANHFYLHRKLMPQDVRHKAALWWALTGLFSLNVGRAIFKRDAGLVTGMIQGAWEQSHGRGLIDPQTELETRR